MTDKVLNRGMMSMDAGAATFSYALKKPRTNRAPILHNSVFLAVAKGYKAIIKQGERERT